MPSRVSPTREEREYLLQIDRNPERRHLLDMADQSAQRLQTLIDEILDFSRIEVAENGRDALERWVAGDFDIVLMDLQMPEVNGIEGTRAIRERESEGTRHTRCAREREPGGEKIKGLCQQA